MGILLKLKQGIRQNWIPGPRQTKPNRLPHLACSARGLQGWFVKLACETGWGRRFRLPGDSSHLLSLSHNAANPLNSWQTLSRIPQRCPKPLTRKLTSNQGERSILAITCLTSHTTRYSFYLGRSAVTVLAVLGLYGEAWSLVSRNPRSDAIRNLEYRYRLPLAPGTLWILRGEFNVEPSGLRISSR